jgi:hypothetical protein
MRSILEILPRTSVLRQTSASLVVQLALKYQFLRAACAIQRFDARLSLDWHLTFRG